MPQSFYRIICLQENTKDTINNILYGNKRVIPKEDYKHILNSERLCNVFRILDKKRYTEFCCDYHFDMVNIKNDYNYVFKKAGILNNLSANKQNVDTTQLEAVIDRYAGDDEYRRLREQSPGYRTAGKSNRGESQTCTVYKKKAESFKTSKDAHILVRKDHNKFC